MHLVSVGMFYWLLKNSPKRKRILPFKGNLGLLALILGILKQIVVFRGACRKTYRVTHADYFGAYGVGGAGVEDHYPGNHPFEGLGRRHPKSPHCFVTS